MLNCDKKTLRNKKIFQKNSKILKFFFSTVPCSQHFRYRVYTQRHTLLNRKTKKLESAIYLILRPVLSHFYIFGFMLSAPASTLIASLHTARHRVIATPNST